MRSFMYTIKVPVGMHARHAGLLVKEVSQFECAVTLSRGERTADARRILGLMGLGVKQGDLVTVTCDGPDEDVAAKHLKDFLWLNF